MSLNPAAQDAPDPDLADARALQQGDEAALERLMARHQEPLFRYIQRSFNSRELARDLTQEAFVRAYFSIHQFSGRGSFAAWLYRIALNLVRDTLKSRTHRQAGQTTSISAGSAEGEGGGDVHISGLVAKSSPDEDVRGREMMDALRAAVAALPEDLRTPFVLCALEEHSHQECAAILGITPKAVEMRIYKARKRLEKELKQYLGE